MGTRETTVRLTVADNFSAQLRAFANQIDNAEKSTNKLGHAAHGAKSPLSHMNDMVKHMVMNMAIMAGVGGISAVSIAILKLGMDMEQTVIAMETLTGSTEKAQAHLSELRDFAMKTPFQFTDLVEASKRMQAYGFAAQEVVPMLKDIGDATAALGGGSEKINSIVRALGQVRAKSKVMAQEMLQLTEAGVPAWKYLAEAMGLSTAEVMKLSEKGLIPANKAIQAILAGMRQDFGGLMAKQATTAAGKMSNLIDKLEAFGAAIGTKALPATNQLIDSLSTATDAASTLTFWQDNLNKTLGKHAKEVTQSTASYEDYAAELKRAAAAAGYTVDAEGRLLQITRSRGGAITTMINANYLLTKSEREVAQHMESWAGITDRAKDNMNDAGTATFYLGEDTKILAELLEDQAKVAEQAWDRLLKGALSGTITDAIEDYGKSVDDAAESTADINAELAILNAQQRTAIYTTDELAKLHSNLEKAQYAEADAAEALWRAQKTLDENTDPEIHRDLERAVRDAQLAYDDSVISTQGAQKAYEDAGKAVHDNSKEIDTLNKKLDDNKKKSEEAAEKLHKLTNEFIYQQASVGLSGEAALELGRALGLVDEQSYAVSKAIFDLRNTFDKNEDGIIDSAEAVDNYIAAIDRIAERVRIFNQSESQIKQFSFLDITTEAQGAANAVGDIERNFSDAQYWASITRDRAGEVAQNTLWARDRAWELGRNFEGAQYWASVTRDRASELRDIVGATGGRGVLYYQSGGEYQAGQAMKVERDEIIVPASGGQVLNKQEAAAAVGGGKQVIFNISMRLANNVDATWLVAQIRQAVNNA